MFEDFLIGAGVNALLQVLKTRSGRNRYARVIAKVFAAIQSAVELDPVLAAAVNQKMKETKP